uniref:Uncharacterized protein n=1 Tax=Micrurus paraensis TaxID=1970185 RepID=A0A2D4L3P5_9SAUR
MIEFQGCRLEKISEKAAMANLHGCKGSLMCSWNLLPQLEGETLHFKVNLDTMQLGHKNFRTWMSNSMQSYDVLQCSHSQSWGGCSLRMTYLSPGRQFALL